MTALTVDSTPKRRAAAKLGWLVPAIVTGGLLPLAVLVVRFVRKDLGANPIAESLNQLGLVALLLLVLSLTATPLRILTGWNWPIRIRKSLGLLSFFYVCLHLLLYAVVDQSLAMSAIIEDITKRPFILVGFLAFVMLVPLALTSTSGALKKLGAVRWRQLHRLAYVIAILAIVHFVLRMKKVNAEPLIYASVLGGLFLVRLLDFVSKKQMRRSRGE